MTSIAAIDDLLRADRAFQHCKYSGCDHSALPLLEKAGITDLLDVGTLSG
jgi:catalase